ncbi:hypothetical protein [Krasilnikovia sp. M28-CT-15]|uniref:hypothetical protein n=1 Tax=Krasilnikovia sp. M28-CT-15 TaxID=3373540 RepID=UPI00387648EB
MPARWSGRPVPDNAAAQWVARLPRVGLGSVVGREMIVQSPSHVRSGDLIISGGERYRVDRTDPPVNNVVQVHLAYNEGRRSLYLHASSPVRVVRAKRRKKRSDTPA